MYKSGFHFVTSIELILFIKNFFDFDNEITNKMRLISFVSAIYYFVLIILST